MLVEFAGASGAGKSTVAALVIRDLMARGVVVEPLHPEFFRIGTAPIRNPRVQNVLLDLRAMASTPRFLWRDREFLKFCFDTAFLNAPTKLIAVNLFRSVFRKAGVYHWLRARKKAGRLAIVDEGTVQSAHNVLVSMKHPPEKAAIQRFCRLVPIPDLIVHVRAPLSVLRARTLSRVDPPCQGTDEELLRFVANGTRVFDELVRYPRIAERTITVEYRENEPQMPSELADSVVKRIMEAKDGG